MGASVETGVDWTALAAWMDAEGLGHGPIEDISPPGGGTQNILRKFTRAGRHYMLRRPPIHLRDNSNETMRREARVLKALAGTDVPHAGLIAACGDESVIGAAFYLMEPVDGFNATVALPDLHRNSPAIRHRMGLAMVEAIAALGALDYKARGLEGLGKPDNYLERQVGRWAKQLKSYEAFPGWTGPAELPGVEEVGRWLEAHVPKDFQPGIIHGDFHLSNVMFRPDSGELAAVVDWELSTIGDPLLDLGWLLATWPDGEPPSVESVAARPWTGFATEQELIDHYAARTTRDVGAIRWYAVLACYKLGIIQEGTHARACAGQAPREFGDMLHAKTIGLFHRALRWIG